MAQPRAGRVIIHYQMLRPPPPLEPFVDCFWLLADAGGSSGAPEPELVLPDGKMELIVHFGDLFEKLESGDRFKQQAGRSLFAGQITERIVLRGTGAIGMVAARFKPGGAARFFRFPFDEIQDQVVDLQSVVGRDFSELQERILNARSHDQRLALLRDFLLARLRSSDQDEALTRQACRYVVESGGDYSVSDLAGLMGISERQLERRFKAQVGISPKLLARIVRFQRFIAMAAQKPLSLTDAAFACGYYDQAHFIRDFRAFAGRSPSAYLAEEHVMSGFFTAPE